MKKNIRIALDNTLREKGITRYELAKRSTIGYQTVDNYYKNKVVRYDKDILLKICIALDCEISDIIKLE